MFTFSYSVQPFTSLKSVHDVNEWAINK